MDDTTEHPTTADDASSCWRRTRDWHALAKPLIRTGGVVIDDIFIEHAPQMGFVEDEELVEALVPDGAAPALRVGIGIRCAKGCPNAMRPGWLEDRIEVGPKLGVAVVDQEMDGWLTVLQLPNHLTSLLRDPGYIGMGRTACQIHAPGVQLDKGSYSERIAAGITRLPQYSPVLLLSKQIAGATDGRARSGWE